MVTSSSLHYTIIKHIIEEGFAPDIDALSEMFGETQAEVEKALYKLQDDHGVVLHPHKPEVWVIHPFSLAPTNFIIKSSKGEWWGNCAWCSLGVAALLKEDLTITTTLGANAEQVVIHITNAKIQESDLYIHFPIPMKNAWDNVLYTCSTMLVFQNEKQIKEWCQKHHINHGDVQPIEHIWEFSKKWYGNHLDPNWKKWTMQEAKEIFREFKLNHEIWDLESTNGRF